MTATLLLIDEIANRRFRELAVHYGIDPDSQFVGGYVQYEWHRIRYVLESMCPVAAKEVLEFGCNIGATSIVAEKLGAIVTGIDTDQKTITLARANAARFGTVNCKFIHVADTRNLRFQGGSFDAALCNSVLEYVAPEHRVPVFSELDRILRPGGILVFHGTSNRLWPLGVHSRSVAGNWVPKFFSRRAVRSVNPFSVRRAFPDYEDLLRNNRKAFVDIKIKQGMSRFAATVLAAFSWGVHISPGMTLRSFMLLLRKPF